MGRSTKLTKELAEEICTRIAEGETLIQICRDEKMPAAWTVRKWVAKHEEFRAMYAKAREDQMDTFADQIIEIAEDGSNDWIEKETKSGRIIETLDREHFERSRLRIDTRKFLMSKIARHKYGEKITQEHTGKDGSGLTVEVHVNRKTKEKDQA